MPTVNAVERGRPVGLDKEARKRRNVVERFFNAFKQWRGLPTRYDKLAITYRRGVALRAPCNHHLAQGIKRTS